HPDPGVVVEDVAYQFCLAPAVRRAGRLRALRLDQERGEEAGALLLERRQPVPLGRLGGGQHLSGEPGYALVTYERIARLTGQMLAAAEAAQWHRLTALEQQCAGLFAPLLVEPERAQPPSAAYRRRKAELIRNILDDDARIRV